MAAAESTKTTNASTMTRTSIRQELGRLAGRKLLSLLTISIIYNICTIQDETLGAKRDYYYTRTRLDPNHLRISEEFKNKYMNDIKFESNINGTKYEYYKSSLSLSHDELVFEAIDKMFKHRLSAFYFHHYDNEADKRRSFDPKLVSQEACARDLMYLVERIPKQQQQQQQQQSTTIEDQQDNLHSSTPELRAFFDSYGRQEAGLLMGNTYWIGAYDQCVNRHIFELTDDEHSSYQQPFRSQSHSSSPSSSSMNQQQQPQQPIQRVTEFKGRYCVSSLKAPLWSSLIERRKAVASNYFKSKQQMDDYSRLFRLQVGICLPSSCDSSSLERHSEEIKLLTTAQLEKRYHDYQLADLYCLPDETSPLRSIGGSAFYFSAFMLVWSTLLFLATIADVCEFVDLETQPTSKRARKIHRFVLWFSLRANYRKWVKVNQSEEEGGKNKSAGEKEDNKKQETEKGGSVVGEKEASKFELTINLRFLNAFKVLIMFWIVNGHIMLLMIQTAKNILYSDALLNGLMHFLIGATFGVDLFFTMTGFLTSYLLFNSGHAYKMRILTWLYLSFHRYWRLAPMYLLTFWFSRSVAQLLGSGPLWDYGTSSITFRGLCNSESWLYPLTLTSNLHGLFEECMITSWYISCDMQFWLISPIYLHLLAKSPLHGWVAAVATIFMSSKVRYDSILTDKSARHDELVQPRADIFMRVSHDLPALYTHPHYRIAAYIVGLLAGHYVYMIKSGKWHSSIASGCQQSQSANGIEPARKEYERGQQQQQQDTVSKQHQEVFYSSKPNRKRSTMAYTGLLLFLVMAFVSYLLSNYFPSSMLDKSRQVAGIFYALDHLMMSIGASLIIISMCFGQWSSLVDFLSRPFWTRLSKMNYALLLLQCEAIYFQIFRYEQVPLAGTRELVNILFNLLVTLYPAALIATLAFEYPLANMEKLLL